MAALLGLTGGAGPLLLLGLALGVAGLVRGFAGFGTALIFMPVAVALIDPALALLVMVVTGIAASPLVLPHAFRTGAPRQVLWLAAFAVPTVPLGVWLLTVLPELTLRWVVAGAATVTLAALMSGWRYAGRVSRPGLAGIGGLSGVLGGATGLGGPPVILFYLAGPHEAAQVRANTLMFLCALDWVILANLAAQRGLTGPEIGLGALLLVPYALGTLLGQRAFHPSRARFYRHLAYTLIALAILAGLPLFG